MSEFPDNEIVYKTLVLNRKEKGGSDKKQIFEGILNFRVQKLEDEEGTVRDLVEKCERRIELCEEILAKLKVYQNERQQAMFV